MANKGWFVTNQGLSGLNKGLFESNKVWSVTNKVWFVVNKGLSGASKVWQVTDQSWFLADKGLPMAVQPRFLLVPGTSAWERPVRESFRFVWLQPRQGRPESSPGRSPGIRGKASEPRQGWTD